MTPKPLSLKTREHKRYRLFLRLKDSAIRDHELEPVRDLVKTLWMADHDRTQKRELAQAERNDKGIVLWEVFYPRTETPLSSGIFDLQKVITRTPRRVLEKNAYWTMKAEWRLAIGDPWKELDQALHQQPYDPAKLRQYAADVDEAIRRHKRRQTFLVKDDTGEVHEVFCEFEREAKRRVEDRFGRQVITVEVKE